MISEAGANALKPHLLSILQGKELKEVKSELPIVYMEHHEDEYSDVPEMNSTSQYINVLSIKTPLFKYDQMCGPSGTRSMMRVLKEWESNDNVIGVVLDIDCPGGQVSGLAEFSEFLANYSKPIVSYTDGLTASAAYYVAASSKYIVSNKNADFIGSIGTMLSYVDLDGIYEQMGAVIKDIYATGSTRKNEESRAMKDTNSEALLIKNILDPARDKFVADVKKFRSNIDESVFEGAIYVPEEALSLNLIDELGTLQTAFDKVIELSKAKKSSNQKPNTNMNTKSLPKLEAVLGLEASLALTDDGSYLNEGQLEAIEASLNTASETSANLQTQFDDANAKHQTALEAVIGQLTEAQTNATAMETSVDAIMENLGLQVAGTLTEKLTAINAKSIEVGKQDGASTTTPKIGAEGEEKASTASLNIAGVDVSKALNC
jgi:protease-4